LTYNYEFTSGTAPEAIVGVVGVIGQKIQIADDQNNGDYEGHCQQEGVNKCCFFHHFEYSNWIF